MKILGKEADICFTDVDVMEKIDNELNDIGNIEERKFDNYIQELRFTCNRIKQYFNTVIADGFADDIPNDYELLMTEFNNFNELYLEANKKAKDKVNKVKSKYNVKRVQR